MRKTWMMALVAAVALPFAAYATGTAGNVGGLNWTVPTEWKQEAGARPMRAATYKIPVAKGAPAEEGELAVFYFGQGQGGGIDANVQRWIGQFTQPDGKPSTERAKTKKDKTNGMPVTTVDLTGTYTASMGPMAPATDKPDFRMLGAIVEGPQGAVFFKMTGPKATVSAAEKGFKSLVASVKK